jgi:hypothetical protein
MDSEKGKEFIKISQTIGRNNHKDFFSKVFFGKIQSNAPETYSNERIENLKLQRELSQDQHFELPKSTLRILKVKDVGMDISHDRDTSGIGKVLNYFYDDDKGDYWIAYQFSSKHPGGIDAYQLAQSGKQIGLSLDHTEDFDINHPEVLTSIKPLSVAICLGKGQRDQSVTATQHQIDTFLNSSNKFSRRIRACRIPLDGCFDYNGNSLRRVKATKTTMSSHLPTISAQSLPIITPLQPQPPHQQSPAPLQQQNTSQFNQIQTPLSSSSSSSSSLPLPPSSSSSSSSSPHTGSNDGKNGPSPAHEQKESKTDPAEQIAELATALQDREETVVSTANKLQEMMKLASQLESEKKKIEQERMEEKRRFEQELIEKDRELNSKNAIVAELSKNRSSMSDMSNTQYENPEDQQGDRDTKSEIVDDHESPIRQFHRKDGSLVQFKLNPNGKKRGRTDSIPSGEETGNAKKQYSSDDVRRMLENAEKTIKRFRSSDNQTYTSSLTSQYPPRTVQATQPSRRFDNVHNTMYNGSYSSVPTPPVYKETEEERKERLGFQKVKAFDGFEDYWVHVEAYPYVTGEIPTRFKSTKKSNALETFMKVPENFVLDV